MTYVADSCFGLSLRKSDYIEAHNLLRLTETSM